MWCTVKDNGEKKAKKIVQNMIITWSWRKMEELIFMSQFMLISKFLWLLLIHMYDMIEVMAVETVMNRQLADN